MSTQKSRGYERIAKERDEARAELAALRQRVAELERERDAARSGHDYAVAEQAKSTAYISELLQERGQYEFDLQEYKLNIQLMQKHNIKQQERISELEASQAIVTPNNCRHCQRAAEQMREAAAGIVQNELDWLRDEDDKRFAYGQRIMKSILAIAYGQRIMKSILAIPLPACDGCNPLKPE